jgi:hypothetical protein
MLVHNQFKLQPGTYQHWKNKSIYVVTAIVTHMEDHTTHHMVEQADPLVVYRDLEQAHAEIGGVKKQIIKVYARRLSEFTEVMEGGVKRFSPV